MRVALSVFSLLLWISSAHAAFRPWGSSEWQQTEQQESQSSSSLPPAGQAANEAGSSSADFGIPDLPPLEGERYTQPTWPMQQPHQQQQYYPQQPQGYPNLDGGMYGHPSTSYYPSGAPALFGQSHHGQLYHGQQHNYLYPYDHTAVYPRLTMHIDMMPLPHLSTPPAFYQQPQPWPHQYEYHQPQPPQQQETGWQHPAPFHAQRQGPHPPQPAESEESSEPEPVEDEEEVVSDGEGEEEEEERITTPLLILESSTVGAGRRGLVRQPYQNLKAAGGSQSASQQSYDRMSSRRRMRQAEDATSSHARVTRPRELRAAAAQRTSTVRQEAGGSSSGAAAADNDDYSGIARESQRKQYAEYGIDAQADMDLLPATVQGALARGERPQYASREPKRALLLKEWQRRHLDRSTHPQELAASVAEIKIMYPGNDNTFGQMASRIVREWGNDEYLYDYQAWSALYRETGKLLRKRCGKLEVDSPDSLRQTYFDHIREINPLNHNGAVADPAQEAALVAKAEEVWNDFEQTRLASHPLPLDIGTIADYARGYQFQGNRMSHHDSIRYIQKYLRQVRKIDYTDVERLPDLMRG